MVAENFAYNFDVYLTFAESVLLLSTLSCTDTFDPGFWARRTCFLAAYMATRSIAVSTCSVPTTGTLEYLLGSWRLD